jgi:uncharacterized Zn finger protein
LTRSDFTQFATLRSTAEILQGFAQDLEEEWASELRRDERQGWRRKVVEREVLELGVELLILEAIVLKRQESTSCLLGHDRLVEWPTATHDKPTCAN